MWTSLVQLLVLFLALPSHALHESDIGVVDWHKSLIGVPLTTAAVTAPNFYSVPGTDTNLILTATGNNVLAALNATDGNVGVSCSASLPHSSLNTGQSGDLYTNPKTT